MVGKRCDHCKVQSARVELHNLHAVQYKGHPGSVLMFISYYYYKNGYPKHFVLMFRGTASLALFLVGSYLFCQNQG